MNLSMFAETLTRSRSGRMTTQCQRRLFIYRIEYMESENDEAFLNDEAGNTRRTWREALNTYTLVMLRQVMKVVTFLGCIIKDLMACFSGVAFAEFPFDSQDSVGS
jgi:hypothetical protein